MTQTIDAAAFQQMVIHAAAAISAQKQHINDLNVFPVPDGDTGTNMSLTISAAAAELKKKQCATVGEVAQTAASALLRGARGNSGVILSLLFRGIAKSLKDRETIDGRDLAIALDFGVAAAYKAVMKPAEGTILTVSRLAAAQAAAAARAEQERLESLREPLTAMGFDLAVRTLGQGVALEVRAIPPMLDRVAAGEFIREALAGRKDDLHMLWATMACKAAIKAGDTLAPDEAVNLIAQWLAADNRHFCPHGRPCVLEWSTGELDKMFKRLG